MNIMSLKITITNFSQQIPAGKVNNDNARSSFSEDVSPIESQRREKTTLM